MPRGGSPNSSFGIYPPALAIQRRAQPFNRSMCCSPCEEGEKWAFSVAELSTRALPGRSHTQGGVTHPPPLDCPPALRLKERPTTQSLGGLLPARGVEGDEVLGETVP
jgi:hypothetical protein